MNNKLDALFSSIVIREMVTDDLFNILSIERNAQISPWSRLSFEEALTRSEEDSNVPYFCRVVESKKQILAYHIGSSVADELHVLNVVVAKSFQGFGLGHMLMQDIEQLARRFNLKKIFLEVRASNKVAQGLYDKWQFEQIAVRKAYYSAATDGAQQREDALLFTRHL